MSSNSICPYCHVEIKAKFLLDLGITRLAHSFNCNNCHLIVYLVDISSVGDLIFETKERFIELQNDSSYIMSNVNVDVLEALEEINEIVLLELDEVEWS